MPIEIILSSTAGETWIAVREDGQVVELLVEKDRERSLVGNIYKGRVTRVLPGMQSAFVNIGLERDAFLYVGDLPGDTGDLARRLNGLDEETGLPLADEASRRPALPHPPIQNLLSEGQELVVQISKDPMASKGARITTHVTLPGRCLVLLPGVDHVGVSRRIEEEAERERLRQEVSSFQPEGGGLIVRTAGEGAQADTFRIEAEGLQDLWTEIQARAEAGRAPTLLHRDLDLSVKILRDLLGPEVQQVLVDSEEIHRECVAFAMRTVPHLTGRILLYQSGVPLLDATGVTPEIDAALRSKVWLKSGGYLVINQTEALVAIDVNTGRYVGRSGGLEETALRTNLEAAREIVRQLRLRDLGGIIVVDFIDLEEPASRQRLLETIEAGLKTDRARTRLLGMSEFGLVELTRKRSRRSLERSVCRPCSHCTGSGRVKSAATVAGEVIRELQRRLLRLEESRVQVRVHPEVAALLEEEREALTEVLLRGRDVEVRVLPDPALHPETFRLRESPRSGDDGTP
jgi:ribonuclease G